MDALFYTSFCELFIKSNSCCFRAFRALYSINRRVTNSAVVSCFSGFSLDWFIFSLLRSLMVFYLLLKIFVGLKKSVCCERSRFFIGSYQATTGVKLWVVLIPTSRLRSIHGSLTDVRFAFYLVDFR
jgi:hypothetical protein